MLDGCIEEHRKQKGRKMTCYFRWRPLAVPMAAFDEIHGYKVTSVHTSFSFAQKKDRASG